MPKICGKLKRKACCLGIYRVKVRHVVADYVSFATTFSFSKQTSSHTHSVAPPLQTEPASLGFGLVFYKSSNSSAENSKNLFYSPLPKRKSRISGFFFLYFSLFSSLTTRLFPAKREERKVKRFGSFASQSIDCIEYLRL